MSSLRRVGGDLEPIKRPTGRRALLPAEAELCNTVGLTETEYWHFVDLTDAYVPDENELRNDPITIIALVVGLALSAVSALMAPKPQEPKQPPNIKTEDIKGRSRFAPQSNFDSVQELSKLGAIVPLVFARKGVRVTSTLLWSQMLSQGIGQQLNVLTLFSSGKIEGRPDFAGYAIGDTLLENYTNAKLALYFKPDGGRPREGSVDRYVEGTALAAPSNDAFSIYWDATANYEGYFSGTRTPGTQAEFGVYAPVPNGMRYKVAYEVVLIGDDTERSIKKDLEAKRNKIERDFPRKIAVLSNNGSSVVLRIDGSEIGGNQFRPHGIEDARTAVDSGRITADESFAVGNEYMVGTGLAVVTSVSNSPWENGYTKDVHFKWIEPGAIDNSNVGNRYKSFELLLVQRVAVGTVSNNRACESTEIGIKSTVYRQINGFANVNSYPGDDKIEEIEEDNGSFALGSLQVYTARLSFFTLEVRPLGADAAWQDITGGKLFCVKGQTPQPHYNFIRVSHPFAQYEFRMRPYPGNAAFRYFRNKEVWELRRGALVNYNSKGYGITFAGRPLYLDETVTCNTEWIKGKAPATDSKVIGLSSYSIGSPQIYAWKAVGGVLGAVKVKGTSRYTNLQGTESESTWTYYDYQGQVVGTQKTNSRTPTALIVGNTKYEPGSLVSTGGNSFITSFEYLGTKYVNVSNITLLFTGVVAATGGSGTGLTFAVTTYSNGYRAWSILSGGTNYRQGQSVYIPQANVSVSVTTNAVNLTKNNFNPYDAISDYVTYDAEKTSHMDNAEHEIVYVNEQVSQQVPQYDKLAIAGLRINSSKEWTTFSNLICILSKQVSLLNGLLLVAEALLTYCQRLLMHC